jgi:hypothetical protein
MEAMKLDILYDETERAFTRYVSYAAMNKRYDFGLVYTKHFFGKTIVFSIQSMQMILMSYDDILDDSFWIEKLDIHAQDVEDVKEFLQTVLFPLHSLMTQY